MVTDKVKRRFVALIRQLRRKGMSQPELARQLDVNQASVSRWQTGASKPHANMARRLIPLLEGLAQG